MNVREVQLMMFREDEAVPNNPVLPAILYMGAFKDGPERIEAAFNRHNWRNSWTGGVYDFHHFHSNAHEALGVVRGSATLQLGGESGQELELRAGDVLVLPAGTGHKRIAASGDFEVVGAYPDGMSWNLWTVEMGERNRALSEIRRVPLPDTDPVHGDDGPLLDHWRTAHSSRDGPEEDERLNPAGLSAQEHFI